MGRLDLKAVCQHCGLSNPSEDPFDGFCCAGCREVYTLIHDFGYEGYYQKQDQVGRPVSGRNLGDNTVSSAMFWDAARSQEEQYESVLYVSGMTCRGCSWLVRRLVLREPQVTSASVSLVSGRLDIRHNKEFDFLSLQERLNSFAYSLSLRPENGLSLSPILVRMLLTFAFSLNGFILIVAQRNDVGGEPLAVILQLLSFINMLLLLLTGGWVYFLTTWNGFRLKHVHSDALPSFVILCLGGLMAGEIFGFIDSLHWSLVFLPLLSILLFARWGADFLCGEFALKSIDR